MRTAELADRKDLDYQRLRFDYVRHPDQDAGSPVRHPVVIVGAGPVGMCTAIDLAMQDVPVVLLDNDNSLSVGSRAICFAKRTLEIFDRLGVSERMMDKGVRWNIGKVFFGDEHVYSFNLLPDSGHERPAFINLQQYYCEGILAERIARLPLIDLRWSSKVVGVTSDENGARLSVETPDGQYALDADWVIACDGSRSAVRGFIGQESKGRIFRDRFLIADIRMKMDRPAERWFWFDPPFHRNQSVLLHMQPDGVWRVDFQLGWDADPEVEKRPENIKPRIDALLGEDAKYELEWASVYTFACLRMDSFRHGRVLFAGDAAHGVSPFGARGANSGIQDAENLAWKLAAVLRGGAGDALIDSYAREREYAADENILNSTRATDFITPKSEISRLFRDATLELSRTMPFARTLVNSGRLSVPATLRDSVLNTNDADDFAGRMVPGAPAADAPVMRADGSTGWLLRMTRTGEFTVLVFCDSSPDPEIESRIDAISAAQADRAIGGNRVVGGNRTGLRVMRVVRQVAVQRGGGVEHGARGADPAGGSVVVAAAPSRLADAVVDVEGLVAQRYDLRPGSVVLLRPDQHVCARWRRVDADAVHAAIDRALARA